jgi:hypothetical protein
MHRQPFLAFPSLDGSNAATEERGDLLPGIQPVR